MVILFKQFYMNMGMCACLYIVVCACAHYALLNLFLITAFW